MSAEWWVLFALVPFGVGYTLACIDKWRVKRGKKPWLPDL